MEDCSEVTTVKEAIGLIEVSGFTTAVEALDSMLKTANVRFLTIEKKLGGRLVTIAVAGAVSAVNEAVLNAVQRAESVGKVAASAVIANPHPEVWRMIEISAAKLKGVQGGVGK